MLPSSNSGDGKVDSAFHPTEIGKMSSTVINMLLMLCKCASGLCGSARFQVNTAGDGMCRRVGLWCILRMTLCGVVMWKCASR